MPPKNRPHNDAYADLREALKRQGRRDNLPCWICKQPIDYDLDYRHPMAYTYDHIEPIGAGGDPRGAGRPAHRGCNSRRGDGAREFEQVGVTSPSIDWLAGPV